MRKYTPPTKTVVMPDWDAMIADMRKGPLFLDQVQANAVRAPLSMFMRSPSQAPKFGAMRPSLKTVVYVHLDGTEEVLTRLSLVDTPVKKYKTTRSIT